MSEPETVNVPLDDIEIFAGQSREDFDAKELENLAENIKANGQLQPGVAWFDAGRGRLILVCGERRFRAIKIAGLPTMAVKVIRGPMTQAQLLEMNISENIQRSSLHVIERAKAFRRMMQLEGITAKEVAGRLKVSDATVSRDLSLLELPDHLQRQVISGDLPASVASLIVRLDGDDAKRALADRYASGELSRDRVAAEVKASLNGGGSGKSPTPRLSVKLDGVSFTITAAAITQELLLKAVEQLQRKLKELPKGTDCLGIARSLTAS